MPSNERNPPTVPGTPPLAGDKAIVHGAYPMAHAFHSIATARGALSPEDRAAPHKVYTARTVDRLLGRGLSPEAAWAAARRTVEAEAGNPTA